MNEVKFTIRPIYREELLKKIKNLPLCEDDGISSFESDDEAEGFIRGQSHMKQHVIEILEDDREAEENAERCYREKQETLNDDICAGLNL